MLRIIALSLLAAGIVSCSDNNAVTKKEGTSVDTAVINNKHNQLSINQKKEGWELLFDGISTNGWHRYGGKPIGSAWKVANGELFLDTSQKENWQILDGGDIVTDNDYDNFQLKLDWKIAKDGNSGIILFIHEDTTKYKWPWETGPEMQILDNIGHPDAKIPKHRAGDLYDLISSSIETVKPAGEWNHVEIKSVNGKLDFFLNNENIVSTMMWDDNWKKLIEGSKFKDMTDFGTYKKGKIGLQDHGNEVSFRNVMIKKL